MDEKSRYPKFTIWYILKRTPTYVLKFCEDITKKMTLIKIFKKHK